MVKLFEDKMGGREAEVVLDDPRSGAGIVSWFNGIPLLLPFHVFTRFFFVSDFFKQPLGLI